MFRLAPLWAFCDVIMDLPPLYVMTQYQPEDCHAHSITGTRGAEHLVKYCTVPVMYRYSYLFTLPVPGICNKKARFPLSPPL